MAVCEAQSIEPMPLDSMEWVYFVQEYPPDGWIDTYRAYTDGDSVVSGIRYTKLYHQCINFECEDRNYDTYFLSLIRYDVQSRAYHMIPQDSVSEKLIFSISDSVRDQMIVEYIPFTNDSIFTISRKSNFRFEICPDSVAHKEAICYESFHAFVSGIGPIYQPLSELSLHNSFARFASCIRHNGELIYCDQRFVGNSRYNMECDIPLSVQDLSGGQDEFEVFIEHGVIQIVARDQEVRTVKIYGLMGQIVHESQWNGSTSIGPLVHGNYLIQIFNSRSSIPLYSYIQFIH